MSLRRALAAAFTFALSLAYVPLAALIATGYFVAFGARRRESLRCYGILFPTATRRELYRLVFRQFQSFAKVQAENLLTAVPGGLDFTSTGRHYILAAAREQGAAVLVMSHLGSAAIAARVLAGTGTRLTLLKGSRDAPGDESSATDDGALRVEVRAPGAPGTGTMMELLDRVRSGELVSLSGDRAWVKGSRHSPVAVAGHVARLPLAPFALAATAGVPALVCFAVRIGPRRYAFECLPPLDVTGDSPAARAASQQRALERYAAELLDRMRAHPEQWYSFERFFHEAAPGGAPHTPALRVRQS